MSRTSFPVKQDLDDHIGSLGVINPAKLSDALALMKTDIKAAAVVQDFERRTGWKPFLPDAEDVIRYFDAPAGRVLDLNGAWQEITEILTGYSPTSAGTEATENEDFYLLNEAHDYHVEEGDPICFVRFVSAPGVPVCSERSIKITGKRGRAATVPEDVWEFCLHYGAYLATNELSLNISRGLFSARDLNSEIRYGGGGAVPLSTEAARWLSDYEDCALRYTRVVL